MNEIAEYKIEPYHDLSDAVTTIERIAKVEQLTGWQQSGVMLRYPFGG